MKYRIEGIDYLRAMMSIFVVIWHMGGGGRSLIFSKSAYLEHVFTASDFINFHLLLLAVPTFIFISIFLYSSKPARITEFKKQFLRVFILLSFWPIALILYKNGYHGLLAIAPSSPVDVVYKVLCAGNTIYYFFTSLIICLFVAHLFLQLNRKLQMPVFLASIVLLAALPLLTKMTGFYPLSAYWSPLNFIPLSFAAVLFALNRESVVKNRRTVLLLSLILCLLFSIFEWRYSVGEIFISGQGYAIPAYTRTSLLFAVIAVFVLALNPRVKANSLIKYMAKYSLALYCLHPFLIGPVKKIVSIVFQNDTIVLYVSIMLVVLFSYSIAMLLRKYYLREKVII
ncbi:MAG: acyltransferase [Candidatus Electrothrix sp. MAN1_4]|nr:acyltransferase [Candidatus Electrothrix sp. MAN1_4]